MTKIEITFIYNNIKNKQKTCNMTQFFRVFRVHLFHFFEITLVYMIYRVPMNIEIETHCKKFI